MDNYFNLTIATLAIVFASCTMPEELPTINADNDALSEKLFGTWQYETIATNTREFRLADANMELTQDKNLGGSRSILEKRRVYYNADGTYQLRWVERGDYSLGTENTPNYQPNYGYWHISGDTLFHNSGTTYQQFYIISITDNNLSRTSSRYMNLALKGSNWSAGDYVSQIENFIKIERQ